MAQRVSQKTALRIDAAKNPRQKPRSSSSRAPGLAVARPAGVGHRAAPDRGGVRVTPVRGGEEAGAGDALADVDGNEIGIDRPLLDQITDHESLLGGKVHARSSIAYSPPSSKRMTSTITS